MYGTKSHFPLLSRRGRSCLSLGDFRDGTQHFTQEANGVQRWQGLTQDHVCVIK